MKKTVRLGVDIGTTSVAVGVMISEGDETTFLPPVVKYLPWDQTAIRTFERGEPMSNGETPAKTRRLTRSMRKMIRRRKRRMNSVAKLLRISLGYDNSFSADLLQVKLRAMQERVDTNTLCHILLDFARYRGYNELDETDEAEVTGEYKRRMNEISEWCQQNGKTISHFLVDHGIRPHVKDEVTGGGLPIDQSLYREELRRIWDMQVKFDERLTPDLYATFTEAIYYRRPLKSQKHLKNKCSLEPNKRVCASSDPWFESFRTWSTLRNLRVSYDGNPVVMPEDFLPALYATAKERDLTTAFLQSTAAKHLPNTNKKLFSFNYEEIGCMKTHKAINEVIDQQIIEALYPVWHAIYSEPTKAARKNALLKHGFGEEASESLSKVRLASGMTKYSQKAIKKILPFMDGTTDCLDEHYAREAVYPPKTTSGLTELKTIPGSTLRNPLVQNVVNESIRLIRAYVADAGVTPTEIVVEMARSLSRSPKQRQKDHKRNKQRAKKNEEASKTLLSMGVKNTGNNRRRLMFWVEQGGILSTDGGSTIQLQPSVCLYSGRPINLKDAFNPLACQTEHTIPRSRLYMNNVENLTLATIAANKDKDNLTASEYMAGRTELEQAAFSERVSNLYGNNKRKLELFDKTGKDLSGLLGENHMAMTGFIARALKNKLEGSFDSVISSNGMVTSLIREKMDVHSRFMDLVEEQRDEEQFDKRSDLRHHGMDALICSLVEREYIQRLSTANADPNKNLEGAATYIGNRLKDLAPKIMEAVKSTLVFHRKDRDPVFYRKEEGGKSMGVRGSLHAINPVKKYTKVDAVMEEADGKTTMHKKLAHLVRVERSMAKEGMSLHQEHGPIFRSSYLQKLLDEHLSAGGSLKDMLADPRVIGTKGFYALDANVTSDWHLRRDGHYLKSNTVFRTIVRGNDFVVETLHEYVRRKKAGEDISVGADMVFYSKSVVLLGMDQQDLDAACENGDNSFLKNLYWISGMSSTDGRMMLYPYNMTSGEDNKAFRVRGNPTSLIDKYGKLAILDQRKLMTLWLRSFAAGEEAEAV